MIDGDPTHELLSYTWCLGKAHLKKKKHPKFSPQGQQVGGGGGLTKYQPL